MKTSVQPSLTARSKSNSHCSSGLRSTPHAYGLLSLTACLLPLQPHPRGALIRLDYPQAWETAKIATGDEATMNRERKSAPPLPQLAWAQEKEVGATLACPLPT